MSRGVGPVQKRVLAVLARRIDGEFAALETSYLKGLASGDRSNVRRAIRSLEGRGLVRERVEGGRRYFALTLTGFMTATPLYPTTPPDLLADVLEELFGPAVLSLNDHGPMKADDLSEGAE
ncbi:MAG: hypothetical protein M3R38_15180 [Actinomycetota bacterium]|nr:hypothetical protein [Actinomycetota bacterium]